MRHPDAPSSFCCGSSRVLSGGNWVVAGGSDSLVSEQTPAGETVFRLDFDDQVFTYRAAPVEPGALPRARLRDGMDAMNPR